jgi:hypothetical protein
MTIIVLLAALAGLATAPAAPAPDRPEAFACDAAGGDFEEIKNVSVGPEHRISGRLTPRRYRRHGRARPTATVKFYSPEMRRAAGFQVTRRPGQDRLAILVIETRATGNTTMQAGWLRLGEELRFELNIGPGGRGHVEINGRRSALATDLGTRAEVSVSCSTGKFDYRALDWGNAREGMPAAGGGAAPERSQP